MGYLSILMGPMFGQKTTELIRRIHKYQSIGYNVLTINHSSDTRYGENKIISHDKASEKALSVQELKEIDSLVRSETYQVLAIDEAQFFPDLYHYITQWSDELPIHIILAGLDGTSDRKPFGDLLQLIPYAEEVERLTSFCSICKNGTSAIYSKYFSSAPKTSNILIGGSDCYLPVCRKHYLE